MIGPLRWRADDGTLLVDHFFPLQLKRRRKKKNVFRVEPPLTKLSGFAHEGLPLKLHSL